MKEAIGGTYLFQITIIFLLVFTGVMCITINHSKAFGVKDEILDMIQNKALAYGSSEKLSENMINDVVTYINDSGYRTTNTCPAEENYIGYTRDGKETSASDASICVRSVNVSESYYNDLAKKCTGECNYIDDDMPNMYYYDILLFYQIDAPILDDVFHFTVKGSTKIMYS